MIRCKRQRVLLRRPKRMRPFPRAPRRKTTRWLLGRQVGETTLGTKIRYFGDYELLEEIARGGMGVVYKARQISLNRIVALEDDPGRAAGRRGGRATIPRRSRSGRQSRSSGIVPIYEIGEHEGQHYFSMGFVEGESLADKIEDGPLPPREAAEYAKKVAEAVAFAHERRRDPSRPEAGQRAARPKRRAQGHRLRPGQASRRRQRPDGHRADPGHAQLHAARAGLGQNETELTSGRRLFAGGDPVLPADRPAAVSGSESDGHAAAGVGA